jgi:hypothetical protein
MTCIITKNIVFHLTIEVPWILNIFKEFTLTTKMIDNRKQIPCLTIAWWAWQQPTKIQLLEKKNWQPSTICFVSTHINSKTHL